MILVDSDVLIAHLRGRSEARDWLVTTRSSGEVLAVSPVSIAEITDGMRSAERREVLALLDSLTCLPVTGEIGARSGAMRRQFGRANTGIGIADYLIAATADVCGCALATLNVRHFPMFEGLTPPFEPAG